MLLRRSPLISLLTLLSLIGVSIAQAQGICPTPILPPSAIICQDLAADQICYVGGEVTPFAREVDAELAFATPGDQLDLADLEAVELRGDAVVLLSFSASLSDGHVLSGAAFGDVRLEFPNSPAVNLPLTANTNANLRGGAGTGYNTVGSLTASTPVTALGRNEAGDWYFVRADEATTGWVFGDLVTLDGDPATLAVLADDATSAPEGSSVSLLNVRPLASEEGCVTNALILGTPEGAGQAQLVVNNVQLEIGSILTLLLDFNRTYFNQQLLPEAEELLAELQNGLPPTAELVMRVQTLQGRIRATAFVSMIGGLAVDRALSQALEAAYNAQQVLEGTETIIPLDEDLVPVAQPITLPYGDDQVVNLVDIFAPVFEIIDWGGSGFTPAPAPSFEEFTELQNTPPEARPVVGTWQLVDVDPNSTVTSGTAAGGASGGCTSYAPLPSLFAPLTITSTAEGILLPGVEEPIPYNAENNAFIKVTTEDNGDYTAVAIQGDGTTLTRSTADYEVDSACVFDEGDLLTTYVYTYERAPEIDSAEPVEPEVAKEALSGIWEYVGSEQETLTCESGQVVDLRSFAGDELVVLFSEKYPSSGSVLYTDTVPQRIFLPEEETAGVYLRSAFFYPETLEIQGEVVDVASMGYGSQITVEQIIGVPAADSDTLVVREVYNLLMTYDVQINDDFSVETLPFECPDVIRNTHTYRRVTSEVPEETAGYLNLLAESTERWVFTSAEPRQAQCDGGTIDPVFDLVKLQIEPLVDGAKLWLSVPRNTRNVVNWSAQDFVMLTYSEAANALTAELADGVTLSVVGRDEDNSLRVVKESTVDGCEYQAEIVMRPQSSAIAEEDAAPTEVVDSLLGSWQMVSQEPAVSCGARDNAFQYNFSTLQVQPGQYGEHGLALHFNKIVYYDADMNSFRGQDEDTGGIITIPAEVAGDTLVMTVSGPLHARVGTGNGDQMENCSSPDDTVLTITYKRG